MSGNESHTLSIRAPLSAGAHFGHLRRSRDPRSAASIHSTVAGLDIIDLDATLAAAERARAFLRGIPRESILLALDRTNANLFASAPPPTLRGRWKPGSLTNRAASPIGSLPRAIVLSSLSRCAGAARESAALGIPVVALCDTDANPKLANFPVPLNDDRPAAVALALEFLLS